MTLCIDYVNIYRYNRQVKRDPTEVLSIARQSALDVFPLFYEELAASSLPQARIRRSRANS